MGTETGYGASPCCYTMDIVICSGAYSDSYSMGTGIGCDVHPAFIQLVPREVVEPTQPPIQWVSGQTLGTTHSPIQWVPGQAVGSTQPPIQSVPGQVVGQPSLLNNGYPYRLWGTTNLLYN
jgi:hypothetical protein